MTDPTHRPYAGAADLRRMQQALADAYDQTHVRVGDVAWRARHHTHRELALEIQRHRVPSVEAGGGLPQGRRPHLEPRVRVIARVA